MVDGTWSDDLGCRTVALGWFAVVDVDREPILTEPESAFQEPLETVVFAALANAMATPKRPLEDEVGNRVEGFGAQHVARQTLATWLRFRACALARRMHTHAAPKISHAMRKMRAHCTYVHTTRVQMFARTRERKALAHARPCVHNNVYVLVYMPVADCGRMRTYVRTHATVCFALACVRAHNAQILNHMASLAMPSNLS